MAYDPDLRRYQDICEAQKVFKEEDRQAAYMQVYNTLVKAGFGVTLVGDRMTTRNYINGKYVECHFTLLDVTLQRDIDQRNREQNDE